MICSGADKALESQKILELGPLMQTPSDYEVGDFIPKGQEGSFGRELGRVTRTGLRVLMLFLGCGFLVMPVFMIPITIFNLITRGVDDRLWVGVAGTLIGGGLGALFLFIRSLLGATVWVFTELGILHQGRSGSWVVLLWSEVSRLELEAQTHHAVSGVLVHCRIAFVSDGEPLTFDNQVFDSTALSEILWIGSERVAMRNQDEAIQRIEQGESLRFGPFTVSQAGLQWATHRYSWSEIAGLSRYIFYFMLDLRRGEQIRTGVSMLQFEEVGLFIALVKHFTNTQVIATKQ
jgi:hypothetical protein